jgi:hypothetical protein
MATAVWGLFKGLAITTADGFLMSPLGNDLLLRIAQQRLAATSAEDAEGAEGHAEAQRRLDNLLRHPGDRFYDIKCPQGHYTLVTAPEITKAIRSATGDQVTLS